MNENDKFEAALERVEKILNHAREDLVNLLPEIESTEVAATAKREQETATAAR